MARLLYFYPENDLALARDIARYTAPPAAVKLRRAGATLPLWYGQPGDQALATGVNARWLDELRRRFGIEVGLYGHNPEDLTPAPWGWSKASRQTFIDLGFAHTVLPDDAALTRLRDLSHRRTSARAAELLAARLDFPIAPAAVEFSDITQVEEYVASHPAGTVLKLPWSSSGRGLVATDPTIFPSQLQMAQGMLRRQGSVMAEQRHTHRLDFAMLFTMHDGRCSFDGYSLFSNTQLGSYAGNTLAPQYELEATIAAASDPEQLLAIRSVLPSIIEELAPEYQGPLGVDMMVVDAPAYCLDAMVEINFRMTMGHLCRLFYSRYAADGAHGTFTVLPAAGPHATAPAGIIDADTHSGRMRSGRLDLAQPGADFSFIVELS